MSDRTPLLVHTIAEARQQIEERGNVQVGFVPTMGYLHEGHASLVRAARRECDLVVASIFVNPTQFAAGEDFDSYPRDLARDLEVLSRAGADIVFAPTAREMYPHGAATRVSLSGITDVLEGAHRPGHFDGVATVVAMLFNIVGECRAYFGEKDWQQLQVVRRMVSDLHLPVTIVPMPVVREADGLAMSSRNVRIDAAQREQALSLVRALRAARELYGKGERTVAVLEQAMHEQLDGLSVDYAVVVNAETLRATGEIGDDWRALVAARLPTVRLIDNCALGG